MSDSGVTEPDVRERPGSDLADDVVPPPIRLINGVCVGLACVVLAIIGCLLVPLRVGPVPIPLSFVLAAAGNILLPVLMKAVTQVPMSAAVPAVVWFVIALIAATRTSEGDLIVTGTIYDIAFLVVGALAAAIGLRAIRRTWPWGPIQGATR